MQEIYRRTRLPKYDFNKVALRCTFIEIALRHGYSPTNLLQIFQILFLRTTLDGCFCITCPIIINKNDLIFMKFPYS